MPSTPYRGYELYSDTASPDLSASGEYNKAINAIDADIHEEIETRVAEDTKLGGRIDVEASERKAADSALDAKIAKEVADRGSADTALSGRIDNAEAEISANSADLTGIKGLTYGTGQQVFLESDNGSYSSPALEEIQHEIEQAAASGGVIFTITDDLETGSAKYSHTPAELINAVSGNKPLFAVVPYSLIHTSGDVNLGALLAPAEYFIENHRISVIIPTDQVIGKAITSGKFASYSFNHVIVSGGTNDATFDINYRNGALMTIGARDGLTFTLGSATPTIGAKLGNGLKIDADNAIALDSSEVLSANTTFGELETTSPQ